MLSTPLICSSMGVAMDCCTVSASAPTKVVWMRISGGTTLGNWEMGRVVIETRPTKTMRMAMTMATMGRLMKKRYITTTGIGSFLGHSCRIIGRSRFIRLRIHHGSLLDPLRALRDDPVIWCKPLFDEPIIAHLFPHLDRSNMGLVLSINRGHLVGTLQFHHRALRQQYGPVTRFDLDRCTPVPPLGQIEYGPGSEHQPWPPGRNPAIPSPRVAAAVWPRDAFRSSPAPARIGRGEGCNQGSGTSLLFGACRY